MFSPTLKIGINGLVSLLKYGSDKSERVKYFLKKYIKPVNKPEIKICQMVIIIKQSDKVNLKFYLYSKLVVTF